jgi:hypothetical protein
LFRHCGPNGSLATRRRQMPLVVVMTPFVMNVGKDFCRWQKTGARLENTSHRQFHGGHR